ncbi:MAG: hypothetical protein ACLTDR_02360 [Adlercreutzia equolifaciens]
MRCEYQARSAPPRPGSPGSTTDLVPATLADILRNRPGCAVCRRSW